MPRWPRSPHQGSPVASGHSPESCDQGPAIGTNPENSARFVAGNPPQNRPDNLHCLRGFWRSSPPSWIGIAKAGRTILRSPHTFAVACRVPSRWFRPNCIRHYEPWPSCPLAAWPKKSLRPRHSLRRKRWWVTDKESGGEGMKTNTRYSLPFHNPTRIPNSSRTWGNIHCHRLLQPYRLGRCPAPCPSGTFIYNREKAALHSKIQAWPEWHQPKPQRGFIP